MLLLSRKRDEKIMIGDDIVLEVVEIWGNQVKIAIHAPRSIPVHRSEVLERIKREGQDDKSTN